MFGLWALIAGAAGIKEGINSIRYNNKSYEDALIAYYSGEDRSRTYENWRGETYDIDTGKRVTVDNVDGQTRYVRDWKTNEIVKDLYEMNKLAEFWKTYKTGIHKVILFADVQRINTLWKTSRKTKWFYKEGDRIDPDLDDVVYAHIRTGRLCYKKRIKEWEYVKALWGGILGIEIEPDFVSEYSKYNLPEFYCDIWTNEIIDWDDEEWDYIFNKPEPRIHRVDSRLKNPAYWLCDSKDFRYEEDGKVIEWDYEAIQRAANAYNQICKSNECDRITWCFEKFKNGIFNAGL